MVENVVSIMSKNDQKFKFNFRLLINKDEDVLEIFVQDYFIYGFVFYGCFGVQEDVCDCYFYKEAYDFNQIEDGQYEAYGDAEIEYWINPSGPWGPEEGDSDLNIKNIYFNKISEEQFDEIINEGE